MELVMSTPSVPARSAKPALTAQPAMSAEREPPSHKRTPEMAAERQGKRTQGEVRGLSLRPDMPESSLCATIRLAWPGCCCWPWNGLDSTKVEASNVGFSKPYPFRLAIGRSTLHPTGTVFIICHSDVLQ